MRLGQDQSRIVGDHQRHRGDDRRRTLRPERHRLGARLDHSGPPLELRSAQLGPRQIQPDPA
jgi:hypothetical protein